MTPKRPQTPPAAPLEPLPAAELTVVPSGAAAGAVVPFAEAAERAKAYAAASRADATLRRYSSAWRGFTAWAKSQGVGALPAAPQTVAAYFAARDDLHVASLEIARSAIGSAHRAARFDNPCEDEAVRLVLAGIRRVRGLPPEPKEALLLAELQSLLDAVALWDPAKRARARVTLLLGFAGAFRRSELSALNWRDVLDTPDGLRVHIRRSKTDQGGHGRTIGIAAGENPATCPVRAYRQWRGFVAGEAACRPLEDADAVFHRFHSRGQRLVLGPRLRPQSIATIVQDAADDASLDSSVLGGHSLRAGFATQAALNGAAERSIARQTGHKNLQTLRKYIREGTLFHDNASSQLGL